jgi:hypothetical protein
LESFAKELWGSRITLEHRADAKRLFEVGIRASSAPDLTSLVNKSKRQTASNPS